jgi:uncharacterized protein YjbJ (UPF0337 family)
MGASAKAKAKAEQAIGKLKEAAGRTMSNNRMTSEGRGKKVKGDLRQAAEKARGVFKH